MPYPERYVTGQGPQIKIVRTWKNHPRVCLGGLGIARLAKRLFFVVGLLRLLFCFLDFGGEVFLFDDLDLGALFHLLG